MGSLPGYRGKWSGDRLVFLADSRAIAVDFRRYRRDASESERAFRDGRLPAQQSNHQRADLDRASEIGSLAL